MLTDIQQQAIIHCLNGIDEHAQRAFPQPAPNLLAILLERPVQGHPDPTARYLGMNSAPVAPDAWDHPDGTVAALRKVSADLHDPVIQARLATATGDVRLLAWVFLHTDIVIDAELGPQQVCFIDAVDLDDRTYILSRLPEASAGAVTVYAPGASDDSGTVEVLRTVVRNLCTH